MKEFKILKVWSHSKETFDFLSRKYSEKNAPLFDHMVKYFEEQKISPMERSGALHGKIDSLEKQFTKQFNRLISFMKTQENEFIIPVMQKSNRMFDQMNDIFSQSKNGLNSFHEDLPLEEKTNDFDDDRNKEKLRSEMERKYSEKLNYLKEHFLRMIESVKESRSAFGKSSFVLEGLSLQDLSRLKRAIESV